MLSAEELIAFEKDIAAEFNAGHIRAPIHLDGGNEEQLIKIFKQVYPDDWVCCSWRSHYKCLLHGVPPEILKRDILAGKSITLCYPERRIISSAIVGGILPIALGIAWSIKRAGGKNRVWCFVGDMTSATGMFTECVVYSQGHNLPLDFVIEDNGKSVCTPTQETWGDPFKADAPGVLAFHYKLPWPHSGAGVRVNF
jgi:TPP-dependent pyruvate/acetoin dehydrogenase alpha subunit